MKKQKRATALVLALTLAAGALTGCGSDSGQADGGNAGGTGNNAGGAASTESAAGGTNTGSTAATGKVEFWNDKLLNTEQADLDKLLGSINSLSGIEVESITYPDTAAYQTAMQQSINGSDAPGLFTWWSGPQLETLANNGLLEDLTDLWPEYVTANGVSADIAESLTVDGKIYAVPYSIIYNTMIYNKKVFAENNVEVPTTFEEFENVCKTLKANGVTPIALKNDSWAGFIWFQAMLAAFEPQLYQDVCDGTKAYTDKDVVTAMNKWKEMLDAGYFSAPMTIQDMDKSLATGTVAMYLEPNYQAGSLVKEYGMAAGEDIATFVLPSMNGDKGVIFYEVAPLCVAKSSADKDAAITVLQNWFKKEHQSVYTEISSTVNTSEVQTDNACVNEVLSYTTDSEKYQMMLRYYENTPEEIRNVALDELMKFELGNASVDEVLTAIQAKADEIFVK